MRGNSDYALKMILSHYAAVERRGTPISLHGHIVALRQQSKDGALRLCLECHIVALCSSRKTGATPNYALNAMLWHYAAVERRGALPIMPCMPYCGTTQQSKDGDSIMPSCHIVHYAAIERRGLPPTCCTDARVVHYAAVERWRVPSRLCLSCQHIVHLRSSRKTWALPIMPFMPYCGTSAAIERRGHTWIMPFMPYYGTASSQTGATPAYTFPRSFIKKVIKSNKWDPNIAH
ncbi:hypothetical protein AVEN_52040-1 [Araneus ventricosus]|uniref:Uncharacterized protein n=1 Tax=Araneus ventricosus TaxID=182803 RepID=A0A4Y2CFY7_ARAVE|nr:hypothetical protein AVEN_52040-1 [Araneus ventricosus]